MIARTLLLAGTALALATCAAAAGERRDRAPAEAVRACPQHGAGFVEVPGGRTCVRIGGRVRSEAQAGGRRIGREGGGREGGVSTRTEGRLEVDARTPTDYGTVRTFVRIGGGTSTGGGAFGR